MRGEVGSFRETISSFPIEKCGVAEAVRHHFRAEERQSAFRMAPLYFKSSLPMKNEPGS